MEQALLSGLHYPPVDIEKELAAIRARKEAMAELKKKRGAKKLGAELEE